MIELKDYNYFIGDHCYLLQKSTKTFIKKTENDNIALFLAGESILLGILIKKRCDPLLIIDGTNNISGITFSYDLKEMPIKKQILYELSVISGVISLIDLSTEEAIREFQTPIDFDFPCTLIDYENSDNISFYLTTNYFK